MSDIADYQMTHVDEGPTFQKAGPRHVFVAGGIYNRNSLVTGINSRARRRIPTQTENAIAQLGKALQAYAELPGDRQKALTDEFASMPQLRTMNMKLLGFTLYLLERLDDNVNPVTPARLKAFLDRYEKSLSYPANISTELHETARLRYRQEILMYIKAIRLFRRDDRPLIPPTAGVSLTPVKPTPRPVPQLRPMLPKISPLEIPPSRPVPPLEIPLLEVAPLPIPPREPAPPLQVRLPTPLPRLIPPRGPEPPLRTVSRTPSPPTPRGRGRGRGGAVRGGVTPRGRTPVPPRGRGRPTVSPVPTGLPPPPRAM